MSGIWARLCGKDRAALYKKMLKQLKEEFKIMESEKTTLESDKREMEQKIRNFELVCNALSAKRLESKFILEFEELLNSDFKKVLCEKVPGVNDAETMEKLNFVFTQMKHITGCPELYSKRIGAIGGGFSSGKSSFINSFFDNSKVKLAEGINPVTVIPSYVLCDQRSEIKGVNYKNRYFNIETEMYEMLKHDYVKKAFPFELNRLIFYTTVLTPMVREYFEHLCLIDTPGYNPDDKGSTKHDSETAKMYIKDASFLIWIVGIDSQQGAFPDSDIKFLRKLNMFGFKPELPLYIVANKAQLKNSDDIENILDSYENALYDSDIDYEGIAAYDSKKKEQYSFRKKDLFSFIKEHNKPSDKYHELKQILHDVFKKYIDKVISNHKEMEEKRKQIRSIMLDALEGGNINVDDASSKLEDGLNKLLHYFKPEEEFTESLDRVKNIRTKFMDCLDSFFDEIGIEHKARRFCIECGGVVESGGDICEKCSSQKKCVKCNKTYPSTDLFCIECGGKLK